MRKLIQVHVNKNNITIYKNEAYKLLSLVINLKRKKKKKKRKRKKTELSSQEKKKKNQCMTYCFPLTIISKFKNSPLREG